MAKKIVWSAKAQEDRKKILEYWINRNKSNTYSIKLNSLFVDIIIILAEYLSISKLSDFENIRFKVVKDYNIFYALATGTIYIVALCDTRQDPEKLQTNLK